MFKLKKENKSIKDKIVRDIMTLFEKEEDYYKPIKVDIFIATVILNMKVIVKKKILSIKEYLDKTKSYLKGIVNIFSCDS